MPRKTEGEEFDFSDLEELPKLELKKEINVNLFNS
jgi:hypothetical protein